MELLATNGSKKVWFCQLTRPFVLEAPYPGHRYVAIVFSNDKSVTDSERQHLTRTLFASGCRYGIFAGDACDLWEEEMDYACIENAPDNECPEEAFTMTTSHKNETVEEVIEFGLRHTQFDPHVFDHFLVLLVGTRAGFREEVEQAVGSFIPR